MNKRFRETVFGEQLPYSSLEKKMMYRFLFVLVIICGYYAIYHLWQDNTIFFWLNFTVSSICFCFYYLIKYKDLYQKIVIPSIIFIFCMITLSFFALNGFYSASIISFNILGFTIALVFSKYVRFLLFTLFIVGICMLFYIQVQHPDLIRYVPISQIKGNVLMSFADNALLLVAMAMIIRDEYMAERKIIIDQQKVVEEQNKKIEKQNEDILSYNQGINYINHHLEQLVQERTEKLDEQNKQLIHFAFYNAHKVRAPLARILGLINLMKIEQDSNEETTRFYLKNIVDNIAELEQRIKTMNEEIKQDE